MKSSGTAFKGIGAHHWRGPFFRIILEPSLSMTHTWLLLFSQQYQDCGREFLELLWRRSILWHCPIIVITDWQVVELTDSVGVTLHQWVLGPVWLQVRKYIVWNLYEYICKNYPINKIESATSEYIHIQYSIREFFGVCANSVLCNWTTYIRCSLSFVNCFQSIFEKLYF